MAVLASFKAGKLVLDGKLLKPDTRRGLVALVQGDEGLVHLQWSERPAQGDSPGTSPEDDIVVFPEECSLAQIGSGRSYVLKFPAESDRNMFFWMQEPDAATDTVAVERFNRVLAGDVTMQDVPEAAPAAAAAAAAAAAPAAPAAPASTSQPVAGHASDLAASLRSDFVAAIFQGSALAAAMARTSAPPSSSTSAADQLSASLLAQLAARGGMSGAQRRAMQAMSADQGPSLGQVLRPEVLAPLLSEPGTVERLAEHLPSEHRNQTGLLETVSSQSFRQQMASFSSALQTGQLSLAQFGLNAKGFSVAEFLEAIQESVDREAKEKQ